MVLYDRIVLRVRPFATGVDLMVLHHLVVHPVSAVLQWTPVGMRGHALRLLITTACKPLLLFELTDDSKVFGWLKICWDALAAL